jgi:hypothetical protein
VITARLTGGLGNQMFQYAAARRLALRHSTSVRLDLGWYNEQTRPFQLFELQVPDMEVIRTASPEEVPGLSVFQEPHYEFAPETLALPDNTYLCGYFESVRNFADAEAEIRREFQPRDLALIPRVSSRINALKNGRPLVGVHVRRGDLRVVNGGKYLVPAERIVEGTQYFSDAHFLVFSDEIDWCREHLQGPNISYSEFSTPLEDLFAMSLCDHHIIGNSSFAWWAAFLNRKTPKRVVETRTYAVVAYDNFPEGHWRE